MFGCETNQGQSGSASWPLYEIKRKLTLFISKITRFLDSLRQIRANSDRPRGRYIKETRINVPVEKLFAWHKQNSAISRLTPSWAPLKMIFRSNDGIEKGTIIRFRIKLFKIPMLWESKHIKYQENKIFKDVQTKGPFNRWEHSHIFKSDGIYNSIMKDKIKFQLPFGILSRPFYGFALKEFNRMFTYRHRVLKYDLENNYDLAGIKKRIIVSGAGGIIGSALVPFLRTQGHEVIRLTRKKEQLLDDEIFWDPYKGILDLESKGKIDAVINFNGVNITDKRWTEKQKKRILDSRVISTQLLAEKTAGLEHTPDVFISSSAIGFYGNGGDRILTENDLAGDHFISKVCTQWEKASIPGRENTLMRSVQLRTGVVLTPAGGALAKMMLPFKMGFGAKIASGRQYMSWISIDDVLSGILFILNHDQINGPVNLTSPCPVTNKEFSQALSRVFSKKLIFAVPEFMAKILWGEMGEETLLTSAKVIPEKLLDNGFSFQHKTLLPALKDLLGM